jgi:3-phosphoshikimate 1-carboxyvinyltransferase
LRIQGRKLRGGDVTMPGGVSSQFISAVMMILPTIGGGTIHLTGDLVSLPYLHMTAAVMSEMGAAVEIAGDEISVGDRYAGRDYLVEGDWSAAAPWYALAALVPGSSITLEGLVSDSIQGDSRLVELAGRLGLASRFGPQGVTIDTGGFIGCCCSSFADMTSTPDLVPSWTVLLCLLERAFRLTGVRTLRLKESDRIQALKQELLKLGYVLKEDGDDAISWHGERVSISQAPPVIDTHGDHRIAMAFAPCAVRYPGLVIKDAQVVSKSYPAYWRHLQRAGFTVNELAQ